MSKGKSIDRNQVLDAAEEIVMQRGARELTIDAVAKAVGITKGGVQSCFGTKENLVSAMLQRWGDAYDEADRNLETSDAGELSPLQRHVRVTATATTLNAKAASLLAALLQSREQTTWIRDWYSGHFSRFDTSTDDGRHDRLVFLATEGAFMLRYLGLAEMSESEWGDVFCDIERCAGSSLPVSGHLRPNIGQKPAPKQTIAADTLTSELKGQTP